MVVHFTKNHTLPPSAHNNQPIASNQSVINDFIEQSNKFLATDPLQITNSKTHNT